MKFCINYKTVLFKGVINQFENDKLRVWIKSIYYNLEGKFGLYQTLKPVNYLFLLASLDSRSEIIKYFLIYSVSYKNAW